MNIRKVRTYLQSDREFKWLIWKSFVFLGLGRMTVLVFPFKKIAKWMGESQKETSKTEIDLSEKKLDQLGKAIRATSQVTPWKSNCFAQALCAHWMLNSQKVEHTIYFGVAFDADKSLKAHAWLRVGNEIITGRAGHLEYKVVATFGCCL